jgi:HAD superfamily hydrolase (TIGR01509 family)
MRLTNLVPRSHIDGLLKNDSMIAKIRNIIFDLDGTLIDSSEGVVEATNHALAQVGEKPRTTAEITRFIGHPIEEMFASFCRAPMAELKAAFQEKARVSVVASAMPLAGVETLLPQFRDHGYHMAIATTKFAIHTNGIVRKFGWDVFFEVLASGDEVAHVKPAPDIIHLAMNRLGGTPENTIMIGDTSIDVQAAHGAGLNVIVIKSPFGDNETDRYRPELTLERFSDLRQVFGL